MKAFLRRHQWLVALVVGALAGVVAVHARALGAVLFRRHGLGTPASLLLGIVFGIVGVMRFRSARRLGKPLSFAIVLIVLATLSCIASAGSFAALTEFAIRYIPQSSIPSNCSGKTCSWVKSADNHLYYHNASGYDVAEDTGPTGIFNAEAYGAKHDGTTNDTSAIQAASTAACSAGGGQVFLPGGTYYTTTSITVSCSYVRVVGAETGSTIIDFDPSGTASAFVFSGGATENNNNGIRNIYFKSTGSNTQTKRAVEVYDISGFVLDNVQCDPTNSSTWTGGTSVCLWVRGRQAGRFSNLTAFCDLPIQISDDPNTMGVVDDDHMHFSDLYLRSTPSSNNPDILVDDAIIITSLTFDGFEAWVNGGFYWSGPTTSTSNDNVVIENVRCEQATNTSGWCIYIDVADPVYGLLLENVKTTTGENGIHLSGFSNATIANSIFLNNSASYTDLEIGSGSAYDLLLLNNYVNPSGLTNLNGMVELYNTGQRVAGATMPSTAHYVHSGAYTLDVPVTVGPNWQMTSGGVKVTAAANTSPFLISGNATGGNQMVVIENGSTLEGYFDAAGDYYSVGGIIDTTSSVQQQICHTNCSSVALGRSNAVTYVNGQLNSVGTTFASLGSPANGTIIYCSDCTIANPCAGSGTGAFAKRLNGTWVCN